MVEVLQQRHGVKIHKHKPHQTQLKIGGNKCVIYNGSEYGNVQQVPPQQTRNLAGGRGKTARRRKKQMNRADQASQSYIGNKAERAQDGYDAAISNNPNKNLNLVESIHSNRNKKPENVINEIRSIDISDSDENSNKSQFTIEKQQQDAEFVLLEKKQKQMSRRNRLLQANNRKGNRSIGSNTVDANAIKYSWPVDGKINKYLRENKTTR